MASSYLKGEIMKKKNNLIYDLFDKPPVGKWIIFALQHVLAMFGATILVPILVNQGAGEIQARMITSSSRVRSSWVKSFVF